MGEKQWQQRIKFFIPSFLLPEPRTLEILCVFLITYKKEWQKGVEIWEGLIQGWASFFFYLPVKQPWVLYFSKVQPEFLLPHNTKWPIQLPCPAVWLAAHLIRLSSEIHFLEQIHHVCFISSHFLCRTDLDQLFVQKRRQHDYQSWTFVAVWNH